MTLDRLVQEVRERYAREATEEALRIESEKAAIIADRDRRVQGLQTEIARHSATDVARERVQRIAAAKLSARKQVFEAQEERAHQSLLQVRQTLIAFSQSPEYPEVLSRMRDFAAQRLGPQLTLGGRAEDAPLLRSLTGAKVAPTPLPVIGGIVAETPDGSRRLDLSFDELLRLREDRVRSLLKV